LLLFVGCDTNSRCVMGKLNVTVLRYLTKEDFRVLTAVGRNMINIIYVNFAEISN
jgi:RIO-like serine/threonine protein kinase